MDGTDEMDLAHVLGGLAIDMQNQIDTEATLASIVEGAVAIVPGTRWAGISLIEGRNVEARAPSSPRVTRLDTLQSEVDEGPCLSALREHRTVVINDMATETRWPNFCSAAFELGARSLLSFQLFVTHKNLGALNLYGDDAGAFTDESVFTGELLAQHASVALFGVAAEDQFHDALSTRDLIGQAKGILMERYDVDAFAAFDLLRRLSQQSNHKLVDLARKVVQTRKGS
ncbi:GAF and ANTAR domain-containing protein [Mycobacterium asiaticum]|uniref:Response regulator receiver protein n=1 Tax=Mycobacterium asiaticum TaxID=1790 RepID=A0A1A3N9N4_MYCAS|nr:GAF and ANTAR domain-containing protein [Mycobacterium asiaticum]OBK18496.1 response regulator receiver protein [Mycobacterium asiaticum]